MTRNLSEAEHSTRKADSTEIYTCPFCHVYTEIPVAPSSDEFKITLEHRCRIARKFVRMDRVPS